MPSPCRGKAPKTRQDRRIGAEARAIPGTATGQGAQGTAHLPQANGQGGGQPAHLPRPAGGFDDNTSERAIRNIKVKQRISGQFKGPRAAQNFAVTRSVMDTPMKNGMYVLDALPMIARSQLRTIG